MERRAHEPHKKTRVLIKFGKYLEVHDPFSFSAPKTKFSHPDRIIRGQAPALRHKENTKIKGLADHKPRMNFLRAFVSSSVPHPITLVTERGWHIWFCLVRVSQDPKKIMKKTIASGVPLVYYARLVINRKLCFIRGGICCRSRM